MRNATLIAALTISSLAFTLSARSQVFRNLDFSDVCDTCKTGVAFWDLSWSGNRTVIKQTIGAQGHPALMIADPNDAVGFVEQQVRLPVLRTPRIFRVSGNVRTDNVVGKGAGLNVAIHDSTGTLLANADMGFGSFSWCTGTQGLRRLDLDVVCPVNTARIALGAILYGQGTAWFSDYKVTLVPLEDRVPGSRAIAYVNAACDTIAAHSLHRDSVDLKTLRSVAMQVAGPDGDLRDLHLAVQFLLAGLNDHHSFLMRPEEVKAWEGNGAPTAVEYASHRIIQGCGYIAVPSFDSNDSTLMAAFVDTIQQALHRFDGAGIRGWIIDLRENKGGNMNPMVCGLGPLFDPGTLGQLVDAQGRASRWAYRDGIYMWDDRTAMTAPHPVQLGHKLPIAVLWGPHTGSSGECTAISFIGNSRTRSFGQPTWGLTTGNSEFDLSDGAKMFLASTRMADRNGNVFDGPIAPDEIVDTQADNGEDPTLKAALKWIGN